MQSEENERLKDTGTKAGARPVEAAHFMPGAPARETESTSAAPEVRHEIPMRHRAPEELQKEIRYIIKWAAANQQSATIDQLAYFSLKIPAFLAALSHSLSLPVVSVVDAIAAFCIALDAVWPRGRLYNAHKRAANELLELQQWVDTEISRIETTVQTEAQKKKEYHQVFTQLNAKRARISEAITQAEASLGANKGPRHAPIESS